MAARRVAGDREPGGIRAELAAPREGPSRGGARLADDLVDRHLGAEGVVDHPHGDTFAHERLGHEGELPSREAAPITAVEEEVERGAGAGREEVEIFRSGGPVREAEPAGQAGAYRCARLRPAGDDRGALRHRRRGVVLPVDRFLARELAIKPHRSVPSGPLPFPAGELSRSAPRRGGRVCGDGTAARRRSSGKSSDELGASHGRAPPAELE